MANEFPFHNNFTIRIPFYFPNTVSRALERRKCLLANKIIEGP
jgi:hypothetical protein